MWIKNSVSRKPEYSIINRETLNSVIRFHRSIPGYKETPLVKLPNLASSLGLGSICIKDESFRFGLNAFKVLGGSFAVGKYLSERLGKDISDVTFEQLKAENMPESVKSITFATTTDGNHGRGVAYVAHKLGYKAVIYMPKGSTRSRVENIRSEGAEVTVTDWNYDETVDYVAELAKKNGWILVQDTAWEGYESVPRWIMQGYTTLAAEIMEQLGEKIPTHVFLQAGVGAFASIMADVFVNMYGKRAPKVIVVEPDKADCFYRSILNKKVTPVTGEMNTIMAGLACGVPNPIAWKILSNYADAFVSVPDWVSARGMRILGNPAGDDRRVVSGESGAVTAGLVTLIMQDSRYSDLKKELGLGSDSKVLLISTEGDTDPDNYRKIVWDGFCPAQFIKGVD